MRVSNTNTCSVRLSVHTPGLIASCTPLNQAQWIPVNFSNVCTAHHRSNGRSKTDALRSFRHMHSAVASTIFHGTKLLAEPAKFWGQEKFQGSPSISVRCLTPQLQFCVVWILIMSRVYSLSQLLPNTGWNFCSYKIVLGPHFCFGANLIFNFVGRSQPIPQLRPCAEPAPKK